MTHILAGWTGRRLVVVVAGTVAACADATRPLVPTAETVVAATTAVTPAASRVRWRIPLPGDYSLHTPAVSPAGVVYVPMANGSLFAVSAGGSVLWTRQLGLGGGVYGPAAVGANGTVYAAGLVAAGPTTTGAVFALAPDGQPLWRFSGTAGRPIIAGPNVGPDGNIYAVTAVGGIGLFSLTPSGQLRFSTGSFAERGTTGQEIAFSPTALYLAFDMSGTALPPSLFAYSLAGAPLFRAGGVAALTNPVRVAVGPNGRPVVETSPVGVGLSLSAFSPTGALAWSYYSFPGNSQGHPDVGPDDAVYSVRNGGTLIALGATGTESWRYVEPGLLFEPRMRPGNDVIVVGGRAGFGQSGFIAGVSRAGQPLWKVALPDEPGLAPYGQLVPTTRPAFSVDGGTSYLFADVAGDGASTAPFGYLYAIDLGPAGAPNTPPQVNVIATTSTTITRGGAVSFIGTFADPDAGDGPWSWRWRFGNGPVSGTATSPGSLPTSRTYPTAGTFTVRLEVTDARGATTTSNGVIITVR